MLGCARVVVGVWFGGEVCWGGDVDFVLGEGQGEGGGGGWVGDLDSGGGVIGGLVWGWWGLSGVCVSSLVGSLSSSCGISTSCGFAPCLRSCWGERRCRSGSAVRVRVATSAMRRTGVVVMVGRCMVGRIVVERIDGGFRARGDG